MKELIRLFFTFAKVGATTIGGGYAMLPVFQRELADKRGWITEGELYDYYAISACTPGVIAVNVATFTGYKRRKIPGAIVATLGVVFPSLIIISIVAAFLMGFADNEYVAHALAGIRVAVCAILPANLWRMIKRGVKDVVTIVVFTLALIAAVFLPVSSVYIVCAAAILGIVFSFIRPVKKDEEKK